jgi:hypothetical protein
LRAATATQKTRNAAIEFTDTVGDWKHMFGVDDRYASQSAMTAAQRWDLHEQSDFNFDPRNFAFGAADEDEYPSVSCGRLLGARQHESAERVQAHRYPDEA